MIPDRVLARPVWALLKNAFVRLDPALLRGALDLRSTETRRVPVPQSRLPVSRLPRA